MKTLTRLNKLAPNAAGILSNNIIAVATPRPQPWQSMLSQIDPSPIPDELLAGVIMNALVGKLSDEGQLIETFDAAGRPLYALPHIKLVLRPAKPKPS